MAMIVFAVLAWTSVSVDATFDFGSPFQWLRDIPGDRSSALSNVTLNDTTTTVLATAPPSYYRSTTHGSVDLSPAPANSSSVLASNNATVSLDDLSLAIGHFQDPVLKLVTEADGSAGFVVFDGRQGVPDNVSLHSELTTVEPSTAPASTTSPTTAQSSAGAVSTPAPAFPGLLAFLRPYIFGAPTEAPVSLRAPDAPPSVASTTITVEPRDILVTTATALGAASTGPFTDAYTTLSATNHRTPDPVATRPTGIDLSTRSSAAVGTTHTTAPPIVLTATDVTFERLPTAAATVFYSATHEFTSDNAKTTRPTDASTTRLEGGSAAASSTRIAEGGTLDWAASTELTAERHEVVTETAAANVSQRPLLPSLLPSLVDGVQEDGTMSPGDPIEYRHFYDPSQIVRSVR